MPNERVVALDVGSVRIGVAASDPTGTFARGVGVLRADGDWMEELSEILRENGAGVILVGMPRRTDGSDGPEAEKMSRVAGALRERFAEREVVTWDERFTTVLANQAMLEAGVSRAGRKGAVDMVAAAILLQNYLDASNGQKTEKGAADMSGFAKLAKNKRGKRARGRGGYE